MLVALVLTVCAVTQPENCRKESFIFESHGGLAQCMFEAQPWIAQWQAAHPAVRVTRWRCENPGAVGKPT
jgi:hypothetical protein